MLRKALPVIVTLLIGWFGTVNADFEDDLGKLLKTLECDVLHEKLTGKKVYMAPDPLPAHAAITSWRTEYRVPEFQQAWVFFIDDQPGANWEHAARLVFMEVGGIRSKVIEVKTPPDILPEMKPVYP